MEGAKGPVKPGPGFDQKDAEPGVPEHALAKEDQIHLREPPGAADADGVVKVQTAAGIAQVGAVPRDYFPGGQVNHPPYPATAIVQEQVAVAVPPHGKHALPADGVLGQHVAAPVQFQVNVLAVAQEVAIVALAIYRADQVAHRVVEESEPGFRVGQPHVVVVTVEDGAGGRLHPARSAHRAGGGGP